MLKFLKVISASLLLFIFSFSHHGQAALQVKSGEIYFKINYLAVGNFIFHLDCLTEVTRCSLDPYISLWQERWLQKPEQKQKFNHLMNQWKNVRSSYDQSKLDLESKNSVPLTAPLKGINVDTEIRVAAFESETMQQYYQKLQKRVSPQEFQKLKEVIEEYWPGFQIWWSSHAEKAGSEFRQKLFFLMSQKKIADHVDRVKRFYNPDIQYNLKSAVTVNLILLPPYRATSHFGLQVGSHSYLEFFSQDTPESRIDVVIHELCHYFFEKISFADHQKLSQYFIQLKDPTVISEINILNEVLATVLGTALVKKELIPDSQFQELLKLEQSLYANEWYDAGAKAILNWMEVDLKSGKKLVSADFAKKYHQSLQQQMRPALLSPLLLLRDLDVYTNAESIEWLQNTLPLVLQSKNFTILSSPGDDMFKKYLRDEYVNALFVLTPQQFESSLALQNMLGNQQHQKMLVTLKKQKQMFQKFKRNSLTSVFILISDDPIKAKDLLQQKLLK